MRLKLLTAFFVLALSGGLYMTSQPVASRKSDHTASRAAFSIAYNVFMHPRCVNCHPAGDAPLRGDESRPHSGLRLRRGFDGQGVLTLKCTNCHQTHNQPGLNMPPGAPNVLSDGSLDFTTPRWRLPAAKTPMIFQGRTATQLCRQLTDPKQNGGLDAAQLVHHVSSDPLVLWGWNPGEGRTKPPITHDEFVASVKEWLEQGAACP